MDTDSGFENRIAIDIPTKSDACDHERKQTDPDREPCSEDIGWSAQGRRTLEHQQKHPAISSEAVAAGAAGVEAEGYSPSWPRHLDEAGVEAGEAGLSFRGRSAWWLPHVVNYKRTHRCGPDDK